MLRNHSQKRIFSVYSDEIMQRQHGLQSEVTDIGELTPPRPEVFMITMALLWFEKTLRLLYAIILLMKVCTGIRAGHWLQWGKHQGLLFEL